MTSEGTHAELTEALAASLRADLAGDDRALSGVVPVLSHILTNRGEPMVSDDIIARMRGLIASAAEQLLASEEQQASAEELDTLNIALASNGSIVTHYYALAYEGAVSEDLAKRVGLDPVISPLIRELMGSKDKSVAEIATKLMASQARFIEGQKRLQSSIFELPPEIFEEMLATCKAWAKQQIRPMQVRSTAGIKSSYDEASTRLGLLAHLIAMLGASGQLVCEIETAGFAIFCSAVSGQTRQPRELIVLSCQSHQSLRLALALKACGISTESIIRQFECVGNDVAFPDGFDTWDEQSATALLMASPLSVKVAPNG